MALYCLETEKSHMMLTLEVSWSEWLTYNEHLSVLWLQSTRKWHGVSADAIDLAIFDRNDIRYRVVESAYSISYWSSIVTLYTCICVCVYILIVAKSAK